MSSLLSKARFLNERVKDIRTNYFCRESLDGQQIFFIRDGLVVRTLTFNSYPDKFYDSFERKVVNSKNSAYAKYVYEKRLKRFYVPIKGDGWHKGSKTCSSRLVAVPRLDKLKKTDKLLFNTKYVIEHIDKFDWNILCRLKYPDGKFRKYKLVPIDTIRDMSQKKRDGFIISLFEEGIPVKTIHLIFKQVSIKLSGSQIRRIVQDARKRMKQKSRCLLHNS